MSLKYLSNSELLIGVRELRLNERKLDRTIVEYICEIESRRLFAEIGYPSVLEWLVKDLGYSESSAYRRVMAARAIRAVPEVAMKIEDGSLNLVSLANVQSAIRSEEKRTGECVSTETRALIISQTENKTLRETEKLVAAQFPDAVKVKGIQISLTEDQIKDLERVRELKSHSQFGASLGEIVAALAKDYLDRHDPLRREVRPCKKAAQPKTKIGEPDLKREQSTQSIVENRYIEKSPGVSKARTVSKRVPISPSTRSLIRRRADGGCEYRSDDGHVCGSRYQTEVDHVWPVALGGSNDVANLRLLCRVHNGLMAEKILGRNRTTQFRANL